ncbi:DNA recombination protein RmuC [Desulfoprunum benzoelyticum]|uniref:DNA recombination protein RmuC n=1 Tax=Desulfoprunum benzoelyticum TaxID=1506996 RepID=A0A840USP3_9BACT|nr:DNA recombination protein RmuC [Desulfoprunum benzoelyticum]MBB5347856.1 DNA recombination protein RmuC [Desulfoprunum benzoelyticum]MBM9530717.1 DNA recombination protein RmuC [Desulfoprunum benzoelyticum]
MQNHPNSLSLIDLLTPLLPEIPPPLLLLILTAALVLVLALLAALLLRHRRLHRRHLALIRDLAATQTAAADAGEQIVEQKLRLVELETLLESERRNAGDKLNLLEEARNELRLQFEALAHRIFEEKSEKFGSQNRERLEAILQPLHHQLTAFKKEIGDIYANDTRERTSLKDEILRLRDLNRQISVEAVNLTRALKGDKKVQGNWGEMVLEKVLEQSGLRRGHEYDCQEGLRDRDSRLFRPDVVVHLPEGRDIVIDSKVSLISWERYVAAEEEKTRQRALSDLAAAVRDHLTSLGDKNYSDLEGIRSLDFVIMFMPIEAAFVAAMQQDERLFDEAFRRGIIVATPTTLLATLRTVENIWRYEHQSRNAQEIARRAGLIHDKLCSFIEDMEKIGRQLGNCHHTYEAAMAKLSQGRGNLIAQAGQLTELGVKARKEMPRAVLDRTDIELPN